jgi:hypothetical protein
MAKPKRKGNGEESVRTAPQFAGDTTAADVDRERVAQRAYELYLGRGGVDGQAMEDWLSAERELTRSNESSSAER